MSNSGNNNQPDLDVVILSAGESRRLGRPKQHVVLAGQTLLQRSLNLAQAFLDSIDSHRKPIVISGACLQEDCKLINSQFGANTVSHHFNSNWKTGMASSMECAWFAASGDGMMVVLVDQYQLTLTNLNALYRQWLKTPEQPVAARYAGTAGPPVIWPGNILTLNKPPLDGAPVKSKDNGKHHTLIIDKNLLHASNPVFVDIEQAEADLDNKADLQAAQTFFAN